MSSLRKSRFFSPSGLAVAGAVIIVLTLVIAGIVWVRKVKTPPADAAQCIPTDAVLVAYIGNPSVFYEKAASFFLWDILADNPSSEEFFRICSMADSIGSTDKKMQAALKENRLILSLHPRRHEIVPLLMLQFPSVLQDGHIADFVSQNAGNLHSFRTSDTLGASLCIIPAHGKTRWIFAVYKGVLMASTEPGLIYDALGCAEGKPSWSTSPQAKKMLSATGKKNDVNLFFDWKYFSVLSGMDQGNLWARTINGFSELGLPSGFDLALRKNVLLLNGYLYPSGDDAASGLFSGTEPKRFYISDRIPGNVSSLFFFGFSQPSLMAQNAVIAGEKISGKTVPENFTETMQSQHGFNIQNDFLTLLSGEACFLSLPPWPGKDSTSRYFSLGIRDSISFEKMLQEYSREEIRTGSMIFRKLRFAGLLPGTFGPVLERYDDPWILFSGKQAVFGDSPSELLHYQWLVSSGKTLSANDNFRDFSSLLPEKTSMLIYADTKTLRGSVNDPFTALLEKLSARASGLQALAVQMTREQGRIFTGIYLKGNDRYVRFHPALSEIQTGRGISHLSFAAAGKDSALLIAYFTEGNRLHLADHTGKELLNRKLSGTILGPVQFCDPMKNGSVYLLFNTTSEVYLTDLKGNAAPGFPYKTAAAASAAAAIFDYDGKKDYRILIPLKNGDLINIDVRGKNVNGWTKPNTGKAGTASPRHFLISGKDYIVLFDQAGTPRFYDRRGRTNLKPRKNLSNCTDIAVRRNAQGTGISFLLISKDGSVIELHPDGNVSELLRISGHLASAALFADASGDGHTDLVLLRNDSLVCHQFGKGNMAYSAVSAEGRLKASFATDGPCKMILNMAEKDSMILQDFSSVHNRTDRLEGRFFGLFRGSRSNLYLVAVSGEKILVYLARLGR